jgi:transcription-repair coupling factor (superfamily II helicase)
MKFSKQILSGSIVYDEIVKGFDSGLSLGINGVVESLSCLLLDDLTDRNTKNLLIVAATDKQSRRVYDQIKELSEREVLYFPKKELVMGHVFTESREILWERVATIGHLSAGKSGLIVIASAEALIYRLMSPAVWQSKMIRLQVGESEAFDTIKAQLVSMGYERVEITETPGHFSVRGGILDVFPPEEDNPMRIEFFGDEVDSIRVYDVETQLSIDKIQECTIRPAAEGVFSEEAIKDLHKKFSDNTFINEVQEGLHRDHLDQLIPYIDNQRYSLIDYLSSPVIAFIDLKQVMEKIDHISEDFNERFKDLLGRGEVLPKQAEIIFTENQLMMQIKNYQVLSLNAFSSLEHPMVFDEEIGFKISSTNEYFGKLDRLYEDLKQLKHRGYRIFLMIEDDEKRKLIEKVAKERDFFFNHIDSIEGRLMSTQCAVLEGSLEAGFLLLPTKTAVITEHEIFGQKKKKRIKRFGKHSRTIKSFRELKEGDYVVHESHGIGRYLGIAQVEVESIRKDYLKVQYQKEEFLYIPIEQMQMIQKYVGGDVERVKVNRLGTQEWQKIKTRAKKAIDDMTEELIALYSERKSRKGYAFSRDTEWQREFEGLFPYEETPDQLKSIEEIKADMEELIPMDRLLCGDVGYGKTEVALRAAFKAIADSKQVAILVPTTILAQQHFTTISERFSKYPISVEMMSRFRTKKQQEVIADNLRKGLVDVVVGTHRILSTDVKFKNIGLLIIDEEQRFGVRHKEKIKSLKKEVDVLVLTATPIPRTLHMSMLGVRDLSIIEDPPEDRYPIQTYVTEFRESIISEAIEREIDRGGQVFFVYNIVKDIDRMTRVIQRLVPEARVEFAHGQMSEKKLSDVMMRFLNHEFDVLVSTTIIETGLDISNVNTIIIYNADKMGLSQLYQLRGRVGRSNRVAYAYLTYQKDKVLTEVAQKRLMAIKEFTELGSGFKIALRDLEIRGAGNLLGSQQHGHMEAIGYEMYTKLLTEKMEEIKGHVKPVSIETSLEIQVDSFIPTEFIEDIAQKLEIYKKISAIENREDLYAIEEEIEDRFGTIPKSVYNLLTVSYIRAIASQVPFETITESRDGFTLGISNEHPVEAELIVKMVERHPRDMKVNAGNKPHIFYYYNDRREPIRKKLLRLQQFLEEILSLND